MNKSSEEKIKNVMSIVFDIPINQINDGTSAKTTISWDSLRHMNLIIGLEEEFEIEFNDDDIGNLLSFSSINSYINKLI